MRPDQTELWLQVTEQHRDLWADHAGVVAAENARLRARIRELEETVRILRVQLPLYEHAIDAHPGGPDPRWAPTIPAPRDPARDGGPAAPAPAPRPPPDR